MVFQCSDYNFIDRIDDRRVFFFNVYRITVLDKISRDIVNECSELASIIIKRNLQNNSKQITSHL